MANGRVKGFALPTVLITSVAMMIILLASLSALASIAQALTNQYYQQLAQEAAESGIVRANDCLSKNAYIAQWSDLSQLRPNTTCTGGSACTNSSSCYVLYSSNVRSTFSVGAVSAQSASQTVNVTGTVQLLSSTGGNVVQSYTATTSARVGANQNIGNVYFGYSGDTGSYFWTLDGAGTLRGVGLNSDGQLGNGSTSNTLSPTAVIVPAGTRIASVFTNFLSGGNATFFTTKDGLLYGTGNNGHGQQGLGYSSGTPVTTPTVINLPYSRTASIVYPLGGFATFVVTSDNFVYSMGYCANGVLGTGYTIAGCSDQTSPQQVLLPTPSSGSPNTLPVAITGDNYCMYVRMQGGAVYVWGVNNFGQLGTGNTNSQSTPVRLGTYGNSTQPKATQVITDGWSSWILDDGGTVYGTGLNSFGELGDGTTTNRTSLVKAQFPASAGAIVKIATDQGSLIALAANGTVWGLGLNNFGQLGDGTTTNASSPTQFILPSGVTAVDIYNAAYLTTPNIVNTYVVGSDGKVYGAGSNSYGQLGDGTTTDRSTPVAMSVIDGSSIIAKQVFSGNGTTVILTTNNKIYTVGNNGNGQLGDGTTINSSTPKANQYTNVQPTIVY